VRKKKREFVSEIFQTRPELAALSLIKGGRSDGRGGGARQTQRRSKWRRRGEEDDDATGGQRGVCE
jgi:hypothetical protein